MSFGLHDSNTPMTNAPFGRHYEIPGVDDGTLWLFDPTLSVGSFAGVPVNGTVIPNAARTRAAQILGVSDPTTLNGTFEYARESPSSLLVERTAKGGLHVLPSQVSQSSVNNYGKIKPYSAFNTRMLSLFPGGAVYAFWVAIRTRAALAGGGPISMGSFSNVSFNNAVFRNGASQTFDATRGIAVGAAKATPITGTVYACAVASSGWNSTEPALAITYLGGSGSHTTDATYVNKGPGYITYYSKVSDLSLTKRANGGAGGTFLEEYELAWAEDLARVQSYFADGGPLAGDTWSDPLTTLP